MGPRSTHGVIWDFISKLTSNPAKLDILGNGLQNKSYLFIDDCIRALIIAGILTGRDENNFDIFNIGSDDRVNVHNYRKNSPR